MGAATASWASMPRPSYALARSWPTSKSCVSGPAATTLTPDANPIVGEVDGVEHFYQASGFMGHGFMMAPVVGKHLAVSIAGEDPSRAPHFTLFEPWKLSRFKEGKLLSERMIIG